MKKHIKFLTSMLLFAVISTVTLNVNAAPAHSKAKVQIAAITDTSPHAALADVDNYAEVPEQPNLSEDVNLVVNKVDLVKTDTQLGNIQKHNGEKLKKPAIQGNTSLNSSGTNAVQKDDDSGLIQKQSETVEQKADNDSGVTNAINEGNNQLNQQTDANQKSNLKNQQNSSVKPTKEEDSVQSSGRVLVIKTELGNK